MSGEEFYTTWFLTFLEDIGEGNADPISTELAEYFEQATGYSIDSTMGQLFKAFVAGMDTATDILVTTESL